MIRLLILSRASSLYSDKGVELIYRTGGSSTYKTHVLRSEIWAMIYFVGRFLRRKVWIYIVAHCSVLWSKWKKASVPKGILWPYISADRHSHESWHNLGLIKPYVNVARTRIALPGLEVHINTHHSVNVRSKGSSNRGNAHVEFSYRHYIELWNKRE